MELAGQALSKTSSKQELEEYRSMQQDLWIEQRTLGVPWLITDLITIGSPLVYGEMLLAASKEEFKECKVEHELPTCPPAPTTEHRYSYKSHPYKVEQQQRTIRLLHHAAHFAFTRWTNLYFPGDWVGGPIGPIFGEGIRDVRVLEGGLGRFAAFTPASHTRYWYEKDEAESPQPNSALNALRLALDLDSRKWLSRVPRKADAP